MPLRSLLSAEERSDLMRRLRRLTPGTEPAWGTLTAPRMLSHLADQLRVALGDLPARPVHTPVSRTLVKFLVVNTGFEPPRGKIRTAPEMLTSKPGAWDADVSACMQLAERVGAGSARAVHPAFGPLTPEEWGRLCWKHVNHHLVQFGV